MIRVLKQVDKDKIKAFDAIAELYGLREDPNKANVLNVAQKYKRKCELLDAMIKKLSRLNEQQVPYKVNNVETEKLNNVIFEALSKALLEES